MEHNSALSPQTDSAPKYEAMDEQCRHELQSTSKFDQNNLHYQSQGSSTYQGGKSVRFDQQSLESKSTPHHYGQHEQRLNIEEDNEEDLSERDSEDPDSEILEDRYRQVDPKLDAKIRAIRQGSGSSAQKTRSSQINASLIPAS